MQKVTVVSPANLAFIKYWGNAQPEFRVPNNGSVSMNLNGFTTTTEVEVNDQFQKDHITIDGEIAKGKARERVVGFLDVVRQLANFNKYFFVKSENSFPKGTGIASSASAFSALALATSKVAGLDLNEQELSRLARRGSGSACRSIPDGFVEWLPGTDDKTSYAVSLYPANYWDIKDIVVIVSARHKKVGSSEGHQTASSSPFYWKRIKDLPGKIKEVKRALKNRDFTLFGQISEAETLNLHSIMMTSTPSLIYWEPGTMEVLKSVVQWRENGLESYFSMDAGPNVHILCQAKDETKLMEKLKSLPSVKQIFVAQPSNGARVVTEK